MSERIRFAIDAAVKGLGSIRSATAATERLTRETEESRQAFRELNAQVKKADSFDKTRKSIKRLGDQLDKSKTKHQALGRQLDVQKEKSKGLRTETRATQREIARLNAAMQEAGEEGADELREKLVLAERKLSSLNQEADKGKTALLELGAAHKRAGRSVETLTSRKAAQIARARALRSELRRTGVETRELASEQARLAQLAERASERLAQQTRRLREMQTVQSRIDTRQQGLGQLAGDAGGLATKIMPIVGSIMMGMKNESSFANVAKVLPASPQELEELNKWARNFSASENGAGMTASDVNEMLTAGAQSGLKDIGELKAFVRDAVAMGVAFDTDAGTAGETMSVLKSSMGLTQDRVKVLSGMMNHLANNSGAKAKDIAEVMARSGATAVAAGFSEAEATAISASLLSNGMGDERSATALKILGSRLTRGFAATRAHKIAYDRIGLDAETIALDMQDDASGTFKYVLDAIADAPKEDQSALMGRIFGEEIQAAITSLADNTANLDKTLKFARHGDKIHLASIEHEFRTRIETSQIKWSTFTNKLENLSISVGDAMLPAFNATLVPLGSAVVSLMKLVEENKGVTAAVGIGVAAAIARKAVIIATSAAGMLFGNALDRDRLRNSRGGGALRALSRLLEPLSRTLEPLSRILKPLLSRTLAMVARAFKPLGILLAGVTIADAIKSEDTKAVGGVFDEMRGATLGGAIGAAIGGLILPKIGVPVGGVIGSIAGSYAGEYFGEQVANKIAKSDMIELKIAQAEQIKNDSYTMAPVHFAPVITVNPSQGMDEVSIAQQVITQMNQQYPRIMGMNTISTRLATSGIDLD